MKQWAVVVVSKHDKPVVWLFTRMQDAQAKQTECFKAIATLSQGGSTTAHLVDVRDP
jgi:hypothetical protein